jgi:Fur family ferric uptake transcriptional regulator
MREHGFRVTPQRRFILEAIRAGAGHIAPEEIYRRVHRKIPGVNRTTVYRNLDFLCELRLVVAAQIAGRMVYEIAGKEPHHHLVCRQCGRIEQIDHKRVKSFFERIARERRFTIDMDHLALFGLCQACRRREEQLSRA